MSDTCHTLSRRLTALQGSVMIWRGFSVDIHTDLVVVCGCLIARQYIELILLNHLVAAAYGGGTEFLLMPRPMYRCEQGFLVEPGH